MQRGKKKEENRNEKEDFCLFVWLVFKEEEGEKGKVEKDVMGRGDRNRSGEAVIMSIYDSPLACACHLSLPTLVGPLGTLNNTKEPAVLTIQSHKLLPWV